MLHPDNVKIVKATAPVVIEHITEITKAFYPKMFSSNPELLNVFNQAVGEQPIALASSIVAYAHHLLGDTDFNFDAIIERIAHKHVAKIYEQIERTPDTVLSALRIVAIDEVDTDVRTFRLAAVDGSKPPAHIPGQYVSVVVQVREDHRQPRQYTISSAPGGDISYETFGPDLWLGGSKASQASEDELALTPDERHEAPVRNGPGLRIALRYRRIT